MANRAFQLVILEEAKEDILTLIDFFSEQGSGEKLIDALGDCLLEIEAKPLAWQFVNTKEEGIRRAFVKHPPIVILYKVEEPQIRILAIKHLRSDWK